MNLRRFYELIKETVPLAQLASEWQGFLEFIDAYFSNRNIQKPIIVEVGVLMNAQKQFYVELLNAEHIGIDIKYHSPGHPDIVGDSHNPETVEKLKTILAGRPIDLLFIDGDHTYDSVKRDYELYGPLVKHMIAIHDINLTQFPGDTVGSVNAFWQKDIVTQGKNTLLALEYNAVRTFGIGLIIKHEE